METAGSITALTLFLVLGVAGAFPVCASWLRCVANSL